MDKAKVEKMEELLTRPEVQEKLAEIEKNKELTSAVILDFWKEQGVELTEEDLKDIVGEISDDDLDAVVGGLSAVQKKVKKVGAKELLNTDAAANLAIWIWRKQVKRNVSIRK